MEVPGTYVGAKSQKNFVENKLFYALRHTHEPLFHETATQPGGLELFLGVGNFLWGD